eukprot:1296861-Amphidinium_carterae.1
MNSPRDSSAEIQLYVCQDQSIAPTYSLAQEASSERVWCTFWLYNTEAQSFKEMITSMGEPMPEEQ